MDISEPALFRKALEITTEIDRIDIQLRELLSGAKSSHKVVVKDQDEGSKVRSTKASKKNTSSVLDSSGSTPVSMTVKVPEPVTLAEESKTSCALVSHESPVPELCLIEDSGEEQLALVAEPLSNFFSQENSDLAPLMKSEDQCAIGDHGVQHQCQIETHEEVAQASAVCSL